MLMQSNAIILAGGSGTRLWPASTQSRPKQFMVFEAPDGTQRSLLEQTVLRAAAAVSGVILIVTHKSQVPDTRTVVGGLDTSTAARLRILAEPEAKNTAPAIALAAQFLNAEGHNAEPALVLAADHIIPDIAAFADAANQAATLAESGVLVTFGIQPTRPDTGFGYIEVGEPLSGAGGALGGAQNTLGGYHVAAFREKPDQATAEEYLASGRFKWNSGMFCFTPELFSAELATHAPEVAGAFERVDVDDDKALAAAYGDVARISVDYAVFERTTKAAVLPVDFVWSDVGSWDEAARFPGAGEVFAVESDNNFVFADVPVALCGVEDLIVVKQAGRLLVCRKGKSQLVKELVGQLQQLGRTDLL